MALENFRAQKIIWDRANRKIFETIEANSGDSNGRKLVVQVINQEVTEVLSGTTLSLGWKSRNGAKGLDAFNVVDASKGVFEIYYTTEMLSNIGNIETSLILIDSTGRIESSTFTISVRPSTVDDESVESENSFTALTEALVKVNDFDVRLAQTAIELDSKKIDKGNASVKDINKNLGKFDGTYFSDEFLTELNGGTVSSTVVQPKSITSEKLADKAVLTKSTDFFTQGKNLFDKNDVEHNKRVSGTTGNTITIEGVSTSGHIRVVGGRDIHRNITDAYAIYAQDGQILSGGISSSTNNLISLPESAYTIRVSVPTTSLDVFQLEYGDSFTGYERYKGTLSDDISVNEKSLPQINPEKTTFFGEYPAGKNLFNIDKALKGKQITANGALEDSYQGNYDSTRKITVEPNSSITISRSEGTLPIIRSMILFDEANNPIPDSFAQYIGEGLLSYTINIPYGARDIQISYPSDSLNVQIESGSTATSYEPFEVQLKVASQFLPKSTSNLNFDPRSVNNPWFGKKVVWNGDSITAGYQAQPPFFSDIVANNLGMESKNYAIGGSTIAAKESDTGLRNPISLRYPEMDDDADVIIIAGGTNDHSYTHTPVGTMEDRTNYTFYGALHNLCLGLINKYVGKQIVFMTPIERYRDRLTTEGYSLADYADIIKEVCGYYGIPVLDAYREISLNMDVPAQADALFADTGGHPNQAGHEVMARRITGYLKQLA